MIVGLIILGIIAAGVGIVVGISMLESRVDAKVADTADWVEAEATIQDGVVWRLDKYTTYPSFTFSYSVSGEYFSGRFFLKAEQKQFDELIRTLIHQKFPVQYDPDNPSAWYIAEATIGGCEVHGTLGSGDTTGMTPYGSDGFESIDLHLDR